MKTILLISTCLSLILLAACNSAPAPLPTPTSTSIPTNTPLPTITPTLTPTTPPTLTPTPTPVDAAGNWGGTYISDTYGAKSSKFILEQDGTALTGTFWSNAGSFGGGTITGTVSGNSIEFIITETTPGCYGSFAGSGTLEVHAAGPATMTYNLVGMSLCGGVDTVSGVLTRE